MQLDVRRVPFDAFAGHTVTDRLRIEVPKGLQLRSVIRIVGERYRGKYNEERERDA